MGQYQFDYDKIKRDRVIHFPDMLRELFGRLVIIIIFAIIFAAGFAGYRYMSAKQAAAALPQEIHKIQEEDFTEEEMQQIKNDLMVQSVLEQHEEYMNNSVLMNLNLCDADTVSLQYMIIGDEMQGGNTDVYREYVESGMLSGDLYAKDDSVEAKYLSELIKFVTGYESNTSDYMPAQDEDSFIIRVMQADEESCAALAENIKDCMNAYSVKLSQAGYTGSIALVDQVASKTVDYTSLSRKMQNITNLNTLSDTITTFEKNMSDNQRQMVKQLLNQEVQGDDESEAPVAVEVHMKKKDLLIGAVGGIIVALILLMLIYILRGTLNTTSEVQAVYHLPLIGEVGSTKKNPFLQLWDKLFDRDSNVLAGDAAIDSAVANILVLSEKKQISELLFFANCNKIKDKDKLEKIIERINASSKMKAELLMGVIFSAQTIDKMAEYKHVVFAEQLKSSRYTDYFDEIMFCLDNEIQVEGTVILK